jgi:hypothetical protein
MEVRKERKNEEREYRGEEEGVVTPSPHSNTLKYFFIT